MSLWVSFVLQTATNWNLKVGHRNRHENRRSSRKRHLVALGKREGRKMGRLNQRMTYYVRNIYKKIYEMSKNNIYYIGCM